MLKWHSPHANQASFMRFTAHTRLHTPHVLACALASWPPSHQLVGALVQQSAQYGLQQEQEACYPNSAADASAPSARCMSAAL